MSSSPPDTSGTPISENVARIALAIERYVLPWIFFLLAWRDFRGVYGQYLIFRRLVELGNHTVSWPLFLTGITRLLLLSILQTFFGLTLLISRRPKHLPKQLVHIIVPLAMSYYFFLYRIVYSLPEPWNRNLLPGEWQFPAAAVAGFLAIVGYGIALWGISYLRRSFALMVAVREVVSGGPYAYVRHPMYLGYIFELSGLVLASCSLGMLLAAAGFICLMVVRARLEEGRLIEVSPEYRDYMKRTGFLFPRFHRTPTGTTAVRRA